MGNKIEIKKKTSQKVETEKMFLSQKSRCESDMEFKFGYDLQLWMVRAKLPHINADF